MSWKELTELLFKFPKMGAQYGSHMNSSQKEPKDRWDEVYKMHQKFAYYLSSALIARLSVMVDLSHKSKLKNCLV